MSLQDYVSLFSNLTRAPRPGSPRTQNRHPHKPLLLLAVIDLIEAGYYGSNFLFLSPELSETFDSYWRTALPCEDPGEITTPWKHLSSEGFWHRAADRQPFTRGRSITIESELFSLLQDASSRAILRESLISFHFSEEAAEDLRRSARTTIAAFEYAQRLIEQISIRDTATLVRSQAFRIAVVRAYDYRCAICGVRIFSDEGRAVVEAAHIIPWSRSHDDSPANGLSLCRLCHWAFDAGMLGVDDDYSVLASSRMSREGNHPGVLSIVANRQIFRPDIESLWPTTDRLEWHREHIFRS